MHSKYGAPTKRHLEPDDAAQSEGVEMLEHEIQRIAAQVECQNSHLNAVQVADMVYQQVFGEYDGREAHKRNMALVKRLLGV